VHSAAPFAIAIGEEHSTIVEDESRGAMRCGTPAGTGEWDDGRCAPQKTCQEDEDAFTYPPLERAARGGPGWKS
jgi:hypothetical protein